MKTVVRYRDWVSEQTFLDTIFDQYDADRREVRAITANEHKNLRQRTFEVGDHCLLTRGIDITTGHKLLGAGNGP